MGVVLNHLALEDSRSDEKSLRVIHMLKEGKFFRCYNWSAWLFSQHLKPGIKSIRARKTDGLPERVFVGFPVSSVEQYLTSEHVTVLRNESDVISLELDNTMIADDVSPNTLTDAYTKWYEALPLEEPKKPIQSKSLPFDPEPSAPSSFGMFDVIKQIITYPIEQHSPNETQAFLAEIKQKLARLL